MRNYLRRLSPSPSYEPEYSPLKEQRRLQDRREQKRIEMTRIIRQLDKELSSAKQDPLSSKKPSFSPAPTRSGKSTSPFSKTINPGFRTSPSLSGISKSSPNTSPSRSKLAKVKGASRNQGHQRSSRTSPGNFFRIETVNEALEHKILARNKTPSQRKSPPPYYLNLPRYQPQEVISDLLD